MSEYPNFSIYNNFPTAVLILDSERRIVFKNLQFIRNFGSVKNLEKFSNYFSFDICVLDAENLLSANPVNFAIDSKESFCANAVYQKSKEQFYYYLITSFETDGYRVVLFKNNTTEILYEETEKKYAFMRQQYLTLTEELKHFASLQQSAQAQTVKLALMHRISSVIRESMDISGILNAALKELYNLFGAIKVYYARAEGMNFIAQEVYPSGGKGCAGAKAELSADTKKAVRLKEIRTT